MRSAVDQQIRGLIKEKGRVTFAEFMQVCLYSPSGGFYSARDNRISSHFGTSPASHPAFGALLARQLEQMWRRLGDPPVFHLVEVGSGDGQLARSIVNACQSMEPGFARALRYYAADYQPASFQSPGVWDDSAEDAIPLPCQDATWKVQRVKTEGIRAFRNVVGCILCNELVDNFPVHRFAIQAGRVKEIFVALEGESLIEVLDEPSTPRIEERLSGLGLSLAEGYRGEVCLATEDWTAQLSVALDRGFVLTIDYGELATDLYSPKNAEGTLVCYNQHVASDDPYQHIGQQDITCLVDFTSLMGLGELHGLSTVGYTRQGRFLKNLGFLDFLDSLETQGLSAARTELNRISLTALVDPEEYGGFKVLAQARGVGLGSVLLGFEGPEE